MFKLAVVLSQFKKIDNLIKSSVVTGGTGVVAFTTYGAAGDGRVGAVAVPWFLCLCL